MNFFGLVSRHDLAFLYCSVSVFFFLPQFCSQQLKRLNLDHALSLNLIWPLLLLIVDLSNLFKLKFRLLNLAVCFLLVSVQLSQSVSHDLLSEFQLSFCDWLFVNILYTEWLNRLFPAWNIWTYEVRTHRTGNYSSLLHLNRPWTFVGLVLF